MHAVTLSFAADPIMRWMVPDPKDYVATMPKIFEAFARNSISSNSFFCADEERAVAVWLPAGVEPDSEKMTAALREVVAPDLYEDVGGVFGEMGQYHSAQQPCWYLPLIAVDPAVSGSGLGTALMARALAVCDRTGLPAYLDSSNPRNIAFYQRHGFEILGKIQHGSSPSVHPMLRQAR